MARASERPFSDGREERVRGSGERGATGGSSERTARLGRREVRLRCGEGLKGAAVRTKTRDVRTAGANEVSAEDHNERIESSRLGFWRCSPPIHCLVFTNERRGRLMR
ncbi:hypothetical protein GCM10008994_31800 [Halorubrum ejinorense]|uniref:Uncharacterized protein n=1 Tax=Halorubrum ejinorense TaxID=425309 RepID=A0AAV3SVN5_9EURY